MPQAGSNSQTLASRPCRRDSTSTALSSALRTGWRQRSSTGRATTSALTCGRLVPLNLAPFTRPRPPHAPCPTTRAQAPRPTPPGITAIELCTGQPPFCELSSQLAVMFRVVNGEPPFLSLSAVRGGAAEAQKVCALVSRCLDKDVARRPTCDVLLGSGDTLQVGHARPTLLVALAGLTNSDSPPSATSASGGTTSAEPSAPLPILSDATKPFGPYTLGTLAAAAGVAYVPATMRTTAAVCHRVDCNDGSSSGGGSAAVSQARAEPGATVMGAMTALSHAAAVDVASCGAGSTFASSMLPGPDELEECAEAWAAQRAARALKDAHEGRLQRTVTLLAGRPPVDTFVESQRAVVDRLRQRYEGREGRTRRFSSAKTFGNSCVSLHSEVLRPPNRGGGGGAAVNGATQPVASPLLADVREASPRTSSGTALRPRKLSLGKMLLLRKGC